MGIWSGRNKVSQPNPPENKQAEPVTPVQPNPEPAGDPTPTPTPQFVSVDDFNALKESISGLKDSIINVVGQKQEPQVNQQQTPQIEDVSDDDYEKAIAGEIQDRRQAASIIRKRHNADIQRATQPFQQQLQEMQHIGLGSIAGLTKQSIEAMPHYKTYKKEIDAAINTLPPQQKVNPDAIKGVYDYVVGQHFDEIMNSEKEAWLRQQQQSQENTNKPGRQQVRQPQQPNQQSQQSGGVPDPSEVLDPSALEAIRSKYNTLDIDRHARSQGYKGGWEEMYDKVYKKLYEETEGNA